MDGRSKQAISIYCDFHHIIRLNLLFFVIINT